MGCRCACPRSTSTRWARVAGRSRGSIAAARCGSAPRARAPTRGPPATVAGALHAAELAAALGIRRVYVPRQPGLLSAWGVLAAEVVRDHGRTLRAVAPGGVLERGFRALARAAERDLRREGVRPATVERLL